MIDTLGKLLGLTTASSAELVVFVFISIVLATLVGFLIDVCSEQAGFGVFGNALVLLAATLAGFLGYAKFIEPLRYAPMMTVLAIGLIAPVLGFLSLSYVKTRALH